MNLNLYIIKCLFFYKGISNDFKMQLLIEARGLILPYTDNQLGIPVQSKVADNQLSYRNTQRRLKTTYFYWYLLRLLAWRIPSAMRGQRKRSK